MKLFARVIEGNQEDMIFQAACSQDGYNELWNKGREMWDAGELSKYEIGVFTDDLQLFWSIRPDKLNFESNRHMNCFMEYAKEEFESFISPDFQNDPLEMEFVKSRQNIWLDNPKFMEKAQVKRVLEDAATVSINLLFRGSGLENNTVDNIQIYTKGDLKGYIEGIVWQGLSKDDGNERSYEFLFRLRDEQNGAPNTLVSIDYGWELKDKDRVFEILENGLKTFAEQYVDFLEKAGAINQKIVSLDEKMNSAIEKIGASGKDKCSDKMIERV